MWHGCTKDKQWLAGTCPWVYMPWNWFYWVEVEACRLGRGIAHEIQFFIRKRCLQYLKMAYELIKLLIHWDFVPKLQLFWLKKPCTRTEDKKVVGNSPKVHLGHYGSHFSWQFGGVRPYFRQMGLLCKHICTLFPTEDYQISKRWSMMVDFPSPANPANLAGAEGNGRWIYNPLTVGWYRYSSFPIRLGMFQLYKSWSCTIRTVSNVVYVFTHKTCWHGSSVPKICLIHVYSKALPYIRTRFVGGCLVTQRSLSSPVASWTQWHLNLARSLGVRRPCSVLGSWYPQVSIDDPFKSGTWHPGVDCHASICMAFGEKVELSAYLTCKGAALWWKKQSLSQRFRIMGRFLQRLLFQSHLRRSLVMKVWMVKLASTPWSWASVSQLRIASYVIHMALRLFCRMCACCQARRASLSTVCSSSAGWNAIICHDLISLYIEIY